MGHKSAIKRSWPLSLWNIFIYEVLPNSSYKSGPNPRDGYFPNSLGTAVAAQRVDIFYKVKYRKVASRSTCYYSENQIFWFSKSRIVTCRKFFLGTKLFCLLSEWAEKKDTWQTHDVFVKYLFFQLIRTTFIFWPPHVTNWI